jgi:hypothetical protein
VNILYFLLIGLFKYTKAPSVKIWSVIKICLHTHIHNKIKDVLIFFNHDACFDKLLFHRGADVITRGRDEGG